ncbi:hypothetical protein HY639_01275 [Candidatus Woesearchaeota archaeon]|nr:hypothetical protein [Candidatus Woesearchaeota archaeon]
MFPKGVIELLALCSVLLLIAALPEHIGWTVAMEQLPLLDDFSDGDITAQPTWTVHDGMFFVENGVLTGTGSATLPSMHAFGIWELAFFPGEQKSGNRWTFWIIKDRNGNGYSVTVYTTAQGYFITLQAEKGEAKSVSSVIAPAPVLFTSNHVARVRVTRDSKGFVLYVNGHYYGKGTDKNPVTESIAMGITTRSQGLRVKEIRGTP